MSEKLCNLKMSGGGQRAIDGTYTLDTSTFTETELGFVPTKVIIWCTRNGQNPDVIEYDVDTSAYYEWEGPNKTYNPRWAAYIMMDGTKLKHKAFNSQYAVLNYFVAIKY